MNTQTLHGHWNELKGKIREKWGVLTEDDLQSARGSMESVVGLIQKKTGEARESIERFLKEHSEEGACLVQQAKDTVKDVAGQAREMAQDTVKRAADSIREGYDHTEAMVKSRPAESLAICFGVGILAGVVVGLTLRGK